MIRSRSPRSQLMGSRAVLSRPCMINWRPGLTARRPWMITRRPQMITRRPDWIIETSAIESSPAWRVRSRFQRSSWKPAWAGTEVPKNEQGLCATWRTEPSFFSVGACAVSSKQNRTCPHYRGHGSGRVWEPMRGVRATIRRWHSPSRWKSRYFRIGICQFMTPVSSLFSMSCIEHMERNPQILKPVMISRANAGGEIGI